MPDLVEISRRQEGNHRLGDANESGEGHGPARTSGHPFHDLARGGVQLRIADDLVVDGDAAQKSVAQPHRFRAQSARRVQPGKRHGGDRAWHSEPGKHLDGGEELLLKDHQRLGVEVQVPRLHRLLIEHWPVIGVHRNVHGARQPLPRRACADAAQLEVLHVANPDAA